MATALMIAVLTPFRAVYDTFMEFSVGLDSTVSGGVLRSTVRTMLGTAIWTAAMMATFPVTTAIRGAVFLFVASGINFAF